MQDKLIEENDALRSKVNLQTRIFKEKEVEVNDSLLVKSITYELNLIIHLHREKK